MAEDKGVEDVLPFATSAVREATNGEQVLARVARETGVALQVLSGEDEARLTFLAVRRWFGWSAGRLLVLDIGGGSLEIASGMDEDPDAAVSLPLGAGRLTAGLAAGRPARPGGRAGAAPARTGRDRPYGRRVRPPRRAPTTRSAPPRPSASSPGSPAPRRSAEGLYVRRDLRRDVAGGVGAEAGRR